MDQLGFVKAVDHLGERVVVTVADAANRWLDPGLCQAFGVFDRDILGGFNRSKQHLEQGGCDEGTQTRIGSMHTDQNGFSWETACMAA